MLLLAAPTNGIYYNLRHFRYEFFFLNKRMGWVSDYFVRDLESKNIDWEKLMWDRLFPKRLG